MVGTSNLGSLNSHWSRQPRKLGNIYYRTSNSSLSKSRVFLLLPLERSQPPLEKEKQLPTLWLKKELNSLESAVSIKLLLLSTHHQTMKVPWKYLEIVIPTKAENEKHLQVQPSTSLSFLIFLGSSRHRPYPSQNRSLQRAKAKTANVFVWSEIVQKWDIRKFRWFIMAFLFKQVAFWESCCPWAGYPAPVQRWEPNSWPMNAPLFSEKKSMALSWIGMRGLKYGLIDIKRVPNQPLINRTNKKTCNEIFATDTCRPMPLYPKTKNVAVQWIEFRVSSQIHVRIVPFFFNGNPVLTTLSCITSNLSVWSNTWWKQWFICILCGPRGKAQQTIQ